MSNPNAEPLSAGFWAAAFFGLFVLSVVVRLLTQRPLFASPRYWPRSTLAEQLAVGSPMALNTGLIDRLAATGLSLPHGRTKALFTVFGGACRVWLGVQVWRAPRIGLDLPGTAALRARASMFRPARSEQR